MIKPGQVKNIPSATMPCKTVSQFQHANRLSLKNPGVEKLKPLPIMSARAATAQGKKDCSHLEYLAAIVQSSDDAIISKSLDGIIRSWNEGCRKMYGYTAKQAIGKHISLIIPSELVNEEKTILKKIRNNEVIDHYETLRVKKNGKQFYVSLTVSPIKDEEGNITGISKIARDISSRKKYENELIRANDELNFQNAEKGKRAKELTIANKELVFQNNEKEKRAKELSVLNKELAFQNKEKEKRAAELVIANIELAFQNAEKERCAAELIIADKELVFQNVEKEKRAAELSIANKELAFQNRKKEKRAAELIIANKELAFQNKEKEKRAAELIIANKELAFQNAEKEKRAAELIIANKDLEQFAYIISHNLRAPVANILGASSAMNYPGLSAEDKAVLSHGLTNSVMKLDDVIRDLNHILQVKGKINEVKQIVYFSELVEDISASIKNVVDRDGIEIKYDFAEIDKLLALKSYLYSIFYNLISNSIKYSQSQTPCFISIRSQITKSTIELTFTDNGMGIDLEKKGDQIFGLYKRFHANVEGKGMGLFMVKTQVEALGGKITVKSQVNKGTEFRIEFVT
ncbi:MAG: PAS domain-containing sensor histidine kinase [Ginsengibacter sp.]